MAPGYIIVWHPPASCRCHICTQFNPYIIKVIPWYLQPDAPVIHTGASLIWQLGRGSIFYTSTAFFVSFWCTLFWDIRRSFKSSKNYTNITQDPMNFMAGNVGRLKFETGGYRSWIRCNGFYSSKKSCK